VPSERALQAIVTSTRRVEGGSEDWWIRSMYSDRGTAGRGRTRACGSILGMFDSDLSPSVAAGVDAGGLGRVRLVEERPGGQRVVAINGGLLFDPGACRPTAAREVREHVLSTL
jgi:hypothetical protein